MSRSNIIHCTVPFAHTVVSHFLAQKELCMLKNAYNALKFDYKKTDLFAFYQTAALDIEFLETYILDFLNNSQDNYKFTTNKEQNNTFAVSFDIFASYYANDNYLLPHDDTVDDRKIAFCLYLSDFDTGELLMYNEACDEEMKRVKVQENLFVMFGIENAYHEVNYCSTDGRMAITGWLNWKDDVRGCDVLNCCFAKHTAVTDSKTQEKTQEKTQAKIRMFVAREGDNDVGNRQIVCQLDFVDDIQVKNDVSIDLQKDFLGQQGPFYSRRVGRIAGSNTDIRIKGYDMIAKDAYKLRVGDYILLNDKINNDTDDILDLYYFETDHKEEVPVVKYVNINGEIEMEISSLDKHLFCIKRQKREIYIERMENVVYMEHTVYKKVSKKTN